ncbi:MULTISPECIES: VanZ family protein [unclassified Adlercreutzia]|uniref:VanZ family protein n=1 Tax=unclassified Adlercreutzia TaxID=2636013 RepID=UPI0013ECB5AA|nr:MULTISPECIES: VanZ family protein [unclassified Adlercreutzia]
MTAFGQASSGRASRRRTVASWALVIVWASFIFFMSAHTGSDFDQGTDLIAQVKQWLNGIQAALFGPDVDVISSIAHFCEYAVFGALLQNALRLNIDARRAVAIAVICASLYGVTDEIHQIFVPGRACDPIDWIVDTLGATLGACAWWLIGKRREA